ncbi:L-threonylcarbamoyladenylate synthase, partial [Paenibacillus sp. GM2]|uniref:L-threonylcarbamoyladenylate synthase n=1 Tax=Paenibacillus sp. GM2 TaxID=1622070 RepID=UPI000A7C02B7
MKQSDHDQKVDKAISRSAPGEEKQQTGRVSLEEKEINAEISTRNSDYTVTENRAAGNVTTEVKTTRWWDVQSLVAGVKGEVEGQSGGMGSGRDREQSSGRVSAPSGTVSADERKLAEEQIREAGKLLAEGGVVAFPTETVYGLGADARNTEAVEAVFAAKGRPSDNPLIVHIADMGQLDGLVTEVNETARRLMEAFWPGPLTLVLPVA